MNYGHVRRKKRESPTDFSLVPIPNAIETEPVYVYEPRGEKLYVTKDKRRPTSWRRCLSWIVACTVISVVLIVAILAGTGVIMNQDQNLVKEASVGRNFGGISLNPSVTQNSKEDLKANMSSLYVPRSIESELIIDNVDFDPALLDSNSSAYHEFAMMMENQLKMMLFDKETLEFGASDIGLRVVNVSRDPFRVNYRIGWNYKQGANNPAEPIKMEDVKRRLVESLSGNQGYIDKYHINEEGITVNNVINVCQTNNGGCSHICYYNYITQLFTCTCPTHLVLDASGKNCVEWTGSSEQDFSLVPDKNSEQDFETQFQHEMQNEMEHQHGMQNEMEHQHGMQNEMEHQHGMQNGMEHQNGMQNGMEHQHGVQNGMEHQHGMENQMEHQHTGRPGSFDSSSEQDIHGQHQQHPNDDPTPEPEPEPTAEPTPDHESDKHWSHSGGHYYTGSPDHEPAAKPTPEPTFDLKDHSDKKSVPEPTPESGSDFKSHEEGSHSRANVHEGFDESKDHEKSGPDDSNFHSDGNYDVYESPDEPEQDTQDRELKGHYASSGFKNLELSGLHGSGHYSGGGEHEPSPEPTPEPTSDSKEHQPKDESRSGVNTQGFGEPVAEPAPEPSSNDKDRDQIDSLSGVYVHHGSEGSKPEPSSGSKDDANASESYSGGSIHSGSVDTDFSRDKENGSVSEVNIQDYEKRKGSQNNESLGNHDHQGSFQDQQGFSKEGDHNKESRPAVYIQGAQQPSRESGSSYEVHENPDEFDTELYIHQRPVIYRPTAEGSKDFKNQNASQPGVYISPGSTETGDWQKDPKERQDLNSNVHPGTGERQPMNDSFSKDSKEKNEPQSGVYVQQDSTDARSSGDGSLIQDSSQQNQPPTGIYGHSELENSTSSNDDSMPKNSKQANQAHPGVYIPSETFRSSGGSFSQDGNQLNETGVGDNFGSAEGRPLEGESISKDVKESNHSHSGVYVHSGTFRPLGGSFSKDFDRQNQSQSKHDGDINSESVNVRPAGEDFKEPNSVHPEVYFQSETHRTSSGPSENPNQENESESDFNGNVKSKNIKPEEDSTYENPKESNQSYPGVDVHSKTSAPSDSSSSKDLNQQIGSQSGIYVHSETKPFDGSSSKDPKDQNETQSGILVQPGSDDVFPEKGTLAKDSNDLRPVVHSQEGSGDQKVTAESLPKDSKENGAGPYVPSGSSDDKYSSEGALMKDSKSNDSSVENPGRSELGGSNPMEVVLSNNSREHNEPNSEIKVTESGESSLKPTLGIDGKSQEHFKNDETIKVSPLEQDSQDSSQYKPNAESDASYKVNENLGKSSSGVYDQEPGKPNPEPIPGVLGHHTDEKIQDHKPNESESFAKDGAKDFDSGIRISGQEPHPTPEPIPSDGNTAAFHPSIEKSHEATNGKDNETNEFFSETQGTQGNPKEHATEKNPVTGFQNPLDLGINSSADTRDNKDQDSSAKDQPAFGHTPESSSGNPSYFHHDGHQTTLPPHLLENSRDVKTPLKDSSTPNQTQNSVLDVGETKPFDRKPDSDSTVKHPYLEDILLKESDPSEISKSNSSSVHDLSNVELDAKGNPVIETIVIDKEDSKTEDETSSHSVMPQLQNEKPSKFEVSEGELPHLSGEQENTTEHEGVTVQPSIEVKTVHPDMIEEVVTTNPKIVEYVGVGNFTENSKPSEHPNQISDIKKGQDAQSAGVTENPQSIAGETAKSKPDDPSKDGQGEQGSGTRETISGTTIQPQIHRESFTIPVSIIAGDFPSPYDSGTKATDQKTGDIRPENVMTDTHGTEIFVSDLDSKKTVVEGQKEGNIKNNSSASEGAEETSRENETVKLVKEPGKDSTLSGESGGQTSPPKRQRTDGNETTKIPEELSNNIKDENEEFNTLLGKDFKIPPGESKESLLGKYPTKPIKNEKKKIKDFEKKGGEATVKPAVTPEDYYLQKHVNGNENLFDLDYSLPNEHTTTGDVDSHHDVVPGVSFNPHDFGNHDFSVLQTITPDVRTETIILNGSDDSKLKPSDSKEDKLEKEYPKFDKDYKYKDKVSKKKDLKKKIGSKDGKNVELDDSRKYYAEFEGTKDVSESTVLGQEATTVPKAGGGETATNSFGIGGAQEIGVSAGVTEFPQVKIHSDGGSGNISVVGNAEDSNRTSTGESLIDKPSVTNITLTETGTVGDGQIPGRINLSDSGTGNKSEIPGTIFDGISRHSIQTHGVGQNASFVVYEPTDSASADSENSTTAHPTIIVHGQSGSLQDGHAIKFGDATGGIALNGSLSGPDGHSFTFTNYTTTFSNGSAVHPTIVIRGQSGALQDGHESRFGNSTFHTFFTPSGAFVRNQTLGDRQVFIGNSTVYKIENDSLPGTVFDGHFNPQDGHFHMFTNSSGIYAYSNETKGQNSFVIKGNSGDFGNAKAYILGNQTRTVFNYSRSSTPHEVWYKNGLNGTVPGIQEIKFEPQNETIQHTHQMSPTSFSSGTAHSVNNYFGYISKCAAGQFQCINGTSKRGSACISLSSKCDSINDCSDGSDELGCIESGCPGNFQCSDGSCLKRHLVCNGIVDCSDGSDEKKCETWKCEFDEFQCPSGRCIPVVWQCDSKPDCDNHTDENNCQTSCGNDEYLCPEGWCIPLTYKCNGIKECSNGEDEQLCDCSLDEFKCQTGGCVPKTQVCNGLDDCPDRSDEWGCMKLEPNTNLIKIRTPSGDYEPICADNWSSQRSDEICASLGYFSSVSVEADSNSTNITTEKSFYVLKNDTTDKRFLVNLSRNNGTCESGKFVEISCQEFSCGSRSMTDSSSVEARLVGGMSATAGQWPSVALLYNIRNFHSCTANVLTPRWVLASYNCLKMGNKNLNQQDWKMFGGSTVFEMEKENAETRNIVAIIPHPQVKFNQFLFSNDLALVELDQPLQFTSNVGAVCLPEQEIQPRQICVTAGWGMNSPEDKAIRQQLQYLPVPTMNLTECNSTEHYSGFITEDKICAGYNAAEKSLCYNEEGAPLMCVNDRGEWELQGVLSYHSNCGRGSHPSIFSSIAPVREWIQKTTGNGFERKTTPVTKR